MRAGDAVAETEQGAAKGGVGGGDTMKDFGEGGRVEEEWVGAAEGGV